MSCHLGLQLKCPPPTHTHTLGLHQTSEMFLSRLIKSLLMFSDDRLVLTVREEGRETMGINRPSLNVFLQHISGLVGEADVAHQ